MADDPRSYLLDRFTTDAATLRARAAQLAGQPAPAHGPNAAASERMAEACDDVSTQLTGLDDLLPRLATLAERAGDAFVRSVYGGAATRIAEIVSKERDAEHTDDSPDDLEDAIDDDDALFDESDDR
jgi:hypothetical protein